MPSPLNPHVLAVLEALPRGRGYHWPAAGEHGGCLEAVRHRGETILRASPDGRTYCCGLTLEVLFRAWARAGFDPPIDVADMRELQRTWFIAGRETSGPVAALVPRGLGVRVDAADAQPGDFAQLWRAPNARGVVTGHSVVFLGLKAGRLEYFSTQTSTRGIGPHSERVTGALHIARAVIPT